MSVTRNSNPADETISIFLTVKIPPSTDVWQSCDEVSIHWSPQFVNWKNLTMRNTKDYSISIFSSQTLYGIKRIRTNNFCVMSNIFVKKPFEYFCMFATCLPTHASKKRIRHLKLHACEVMICLTNVLFFELFTLYCYLVYNKNLEKFCNNIFLEH